MGVDMTVDENAAGIRQLKGEMKDIKGRLVDVEENVENNNIILRGDPKNRFDQGIEGAMNYLIKLAKWLLGVLVTIGAPIAVWCIIQIAEKVTS
jgi:hypothetical protein